MVTQTPSLKNRALRFLALREHSRTELMTKLGRRPEPDDTPEAIKRVLDELEALGFLDETRVVESVLRQRAPRLGSARVLQELRTKGLPQELVRDAAEQLRASELERARGVWQKRFGQPPADARERARQLRFLAGRGFAAEVAYRVLREVEASA